MSENRIRSWWWGGESESRAVIGESQCFLHVLPRLVKSFLLPFPFCLTSWCFFFYSVDREGYCKLFSKYLDSDLKRPESFLRSEFAENQTMYVRCICLHHMGPLASILGQNQWCIVYFKSSLVFYIKIDNWGYRPYYTSIIYSRTNLIPSCQSCPIKRNPRQKRKLLRWLDGHCTVSAPT